MLDMIMADAKRMTVFPATCVRDMNPVERRLWPHLQDHINRIRSKGGDSGS